MPPPTLIRWCGLAGVVAGVAYAAQVLLVPALVRLLVPGDAVRMPPALKEEDIPQQKVIAGGAVIEDINTVFLVLLILSVMLLVAAVHALQVEGYGPGAVERIGLGALTILPSIVGLALMLVGYLGDTGGLRYQVLAGLRPLALNLEILGWVVATVGLLALAFVTLVVRALPWWVGPAMIAGNPLMALFSGPLLGVSWALVGYAVLRTAGHTRTTSVSSGIR